jgi:hypothetical protein
MAAASRAGPEMSSPIALALFAQLESGFDHSDCTGIFQFRITGPEGGDFFVAVDRDRLSYGDGIHPEPSAMLTAPVQAVRRVLAHSHDIDWRDESLTRVLQVSGDQRVVGLFMDLIKSTPPAVVARFAEAEAASHAQPTRVMERLERPDEATVVRALSECRPIVAVGVLDDFRAARWTFESLRREHGHLRLRLRSPGREETLGELIARIDGWREGGKETSSGVTLPPALWSHCRQPYFRSRTDVYREPQLWMGFSSNGVPVTHLHRDSLHGFLAHVFGHKRVLLYPPDQAPHLYPHRSFNHFQFCWVKPEAPDLERFPLFRHARPVECALEPGDLLILPAGWFHCVFAPEPAISVSAFMRWESWERLRPPADARAPGPLTGSP